MQNEHCVGCATPGTADTHVTRGAPSYPSMRACSISAGRRARLGAHPHAQAPHAADGSSAVVGGEPGAGAGWAGGSKLHRSSW